MGRIISLHILVAPLPKRKHFHNYINFKLPQIKNSLEYVGNYTKMGSLISMCSFNSRETSDVPTRDSSISSPQLGQHISIRTFRKLNPHLMSRPMWRKTENSLILEISKSMDDQLEEVANLPTTHMPRSSTQAPSMRPSIY
ncbi:AC4 protein [Tomato mottle leaf distortion virus]|nr:AC4 protein [Tomato mottle leaf distortion virus]